MTVFSSRIFEMILEDYFHWNKNTSKFFFFSSLEYPYMADNSKQSFLNTLFQWTVKNTATEEASAPQTTDDVKPMTEDVSSNGMSCIS